MRTKFHWKDSFFGLGGVVLLLVLLLLSIGIAFIYSASYRPKYNYHLSYAYRQMTWVIISLVPCFIVIYLDYTMLTKNAFFFYILALGLLLATNVLGTTRGGARRWLKVGPMMLQTSEIMKIVIIITLAKILSEQNHTGTIRDLFFPLIVTGLPICFILLQPDLGTSLVFIPIVFTMSFVSGIKFKHFFILFIAMLTLGIFSYFYGLHEYQKKRVLMFISQDNMTQEQKRGAGYHLYQSKISHGNGGFWGKGWQKGTQNLHNFLPERHTDFIFALIGEELGLVGTTLVLLLYFLLFFFMLAIAYTSLISSGQLIVVGVVTLLATQTIVNTCMTVGFAPITGLPLPFLSYGGSSLMFNFISIAMVISISGRKVSV